MANSFKKNVEFVGKSYKKEIAKITIFNIFFALISVFLFFYKEFSYFLLIPIGVCLVLDYLYISYFSSKGKAIQESRNDEFIQVITYFQIFINDGLNVYNSFRKLISYCSPWMSEQINLMLDEIDKDKTVQPFINFANKFTNEVVENIMLSIYQMVDVGESNEQLNQFTIFFSSLSKSFQKNLIDKKERSLTSIDTYPLVGTGIIIIVITISILMMMGDVINVV